MARKPGKPKPKPARIRKPVGFAIEPRRVVFAEKPDAPSTPVVVPAQGRIPARRNNRRAKVEYNFWRQERNPDELCSDILDDPTVRATWGQLVTDILAGGVRATLRPSDKGNAKAQEAVDFLNAHDELCSRDAKPLTLEGSVRRILQAVPRGFVLLERSFAELSDPIRTGPWAGKRRMAHIDWKSRQIIDCDEDPFGDLASFRERATGTVHKPGDPEWWQFAPITWSEDSGDGLLYGDPLCAPTYQFQRACADARQAWRNVVQRKGGGAIVATLSEESSVDYADVADTALEMLDDLAINMNIVLPKGMDVTARDLLAKNDGDFLKASLDMETRAIQLLWVYQVASTGTDDSGNANSRARTTELGKEVVGRAGQISRWVRPVLSNLWRPLVLVNFGPDVPMPDFAFGSIDAQQAQQGIADAGKTTVPVPALPGATPPVPAPAPKPGDPPAPLVPAALPGEVKVADTALNGAQLSGLIEISAGITDGTLAGDTARILMGKGFPGSFTDEELTTIVNAQQGLEKKPAPVPPQFPPPVPPKAGQELPVPPGDKQPPEPAPKPAAGAKQFAEQIIEPVRERVRRASAWLRARIEAGEPIDLSRELPLKRQFSEAYELLGLAPAAAQSEAVTTCAFLRRRLQESMPKAKTLGGQLRVVSFLTEELAEVGRLADIRERGVTP